MSLSCASNEHIWMCVDVDGEQITHIRCASVSGQNGLIGSPKDRQSTRPYCRARDFSSLYTRKTLQAASGWVFRFLNSNSNAVHTIWVVDKRELFTLPNVVYCNQISNRVHTPTKHLKLIKRWTASVLQHIT